MRLSRWTMCCGILILCWFTAAANAQDKKLEKLRTGGGSASGAQMSIWFAKEGNYFDKNGLNVEVISIPGSSLAIQAMLSGELPIIQAGGAGPIQAALSGTDTVIIATIAKKFNWWIYSQPNIAASKICAAKYSARHASAPNPIWLPASPCAAPVSTRSAMLPWFKREDRQRQSPRWLPAKCRPRQ